jgi:hypothetical protein
LNALPAPVPEQAPGEQPAHTAHSVPVGHCESLVHQHGTRAAVHWPLGEDTSLQLPIGQDQALAVEVAVSQSSESRVALALPEQVPVHWLSALTHLPLEQLESATQRQPPRAALKTGRGMRVVGQLLPPFPVQGTELGAGMQPCPSSVPVPVQLAQLPLFMLGMQRPLSHATSEVQ